MHGLVNRSLQAFLNDTYGAPLWEAVAQDVDMDPSGVEAMVQNDDGLTDLLVVAASGRLGKPRDALLEDVGAYLASRESLRRLLRFGGRNYPDFLLTLDELPDRIRLAIPDLDLPVISVTEPGQSRILVSCAMPFYRHVLAGLLRAMADDYGALAVIDTRDDGSLCVELMDVEFAAGRRFDLARPGVE